MYRLLIVLSLLLTACIGGGEGETSNSSDSSVSDTLPAETTYLPPPVTTGASSETDGTSTGTASDSGTGTGGPLCGNGVVDAGEFCDDEINDGAYGGCNPDCTLAPFCGDGIVDAPHEVCDGGEGCPLDCGLSGCLLICEAKGC